VKKRRPTGSSVVRRTVADCTTDTEVRRLSHAMQLAVTIVFIPADSSQSLYSPMMNAEIIE